MGVLLSGGVGCGAELAEQVGGELVGHAQPGAQDVAGDGLAVGGVVLGGDAPGEVEQRGGRPGLAGMGTAVPSWAGTGRTTGRCPEAGWWLVRRSSMETATRNAAAGVAG